MPSRETIYYNKSYDLGDWAWLHTSVVTTRQEVQIGP
jgi:hypothetical protein